MRKREEDTVNLPYPLNNTCFKRNATCCKTCNYTQGGTRSMHVCILFRGIRVGDWIDTILGGFLSRMDLGYGNNHFLVSLLFIITKGIHRFRQ